MRITILKLRLLFVLLLSAAPHGATAKEEDLTLWYEKPATRWIDALALGNGRLGAMVFGGTAAERIGLNEDTLWSGGPYEPSTEVDPKTREEIKRLMFEGKFREAQNLSNKLQGTPNSQSSYQTIGELLLNFPGHENATDYRRELDISTAIATVTYQVGGVHFQREVFVSPVDQAVVVHITADKPGKVNLSATYASPLEHEVTSAGDQLRITGKNGDLLNRQTKKVEVAGALRFESRARLTTDGGTVSAADGKLTVTGADSATLFVVSATSFKRYDDVSGVPAAANTATLAKLQERTIEAMRKDHVAEHARLFGRVKLDLGRTPAADLPTDQRIRDFGKQPDPALVALHFQFGRYLLMSSSRPGSQPANLQGLWNEQLMAPWGGKYTVNINTQMNYWPAAVTNLSETTEPLFRMVGEVANGSGPKTAHRTYQANGWVLHHNTDLWRPSAPIDSAFWGQWQTGGAWLAVQLWDTWRFSGDRKQLETLYPILKGSARFFMDTLVEEPEHKWLVTLPSNSPEHSFEKNVTVSYGPTMDMQILRDLFTACIDASTTLGVDSDLRKTWQTTRERLAPDQIGAKGQLQEWIKDWDFNEACEPTHRHMSPFYGVFPGFDITPDNKDVFAAARVLAERRGSAGMGWANAWRIGIWARLLDSAKAGEFVDLMLAKWTEANLFDRPSVQLDGNWGFTAGVAEMLLQSHRGAIDLLPAWPMDKWPDGSIAGLRARGGHEVDIEWKKGELVRAVIHADSRDIPPIRYAGKLLDPRRDPRMVVSNRR